MSTTSIQLTEANAELVRQNRALLLRAYKDWFNIDDAEVEQTKAIFQSVFGVKEELRGLPLADALLLNCPKADSELYYAMVVNEEDRSIAWHKVLLSRMNNVGINTEVTTLDMLLMFMGSHNRDECTGDDCTLLSDFFGVWRRHFSPERIRRVTGRDAGSDEPIVRDATSLARMRREARMLGFEDYTADEEAEYNICLDWVDPESLDKGFAPETFSVSLECDDDSQYGVCIDEMYGPYPTHLRFWGDWDEYLTLCMKK